MGCSCVHGQLVDNRIQPCHNVRTKVSPGSPKVKCDRWSMDGRAVSHTMQVVCDSGEPRRADNTDDTRALNPFLDLYHMI